MEMKNALALRLDAFPRLSPSTFCSCGSQMLDATHHLGCRLQLSSASTQRHNQVLNCLVSLGNRLQIRTTANPRYQGFDHSLLIPDAEFSLLASHQSYRLTLTDVSVVHITSPSYLSRQIDPVIARESEKNNSYRDLARSRQASFIPFVLDTYGGFGKQASQLLNLLCAEEATLGFRPSIFEGLHPAAYTRRAISFALQRGNSSIISAGINSWPAAPLPQS
jgi:hypothetical protein